MDAFGTGLTGAVWFLTAVFSATLTLLMVIVVARDLVRPSLTRADFDKVVRAAEAAVRARLADEDGPR